MTRLVVLAASLSIVPLLSIQSPQAPPRASATPTTGTATVSGTVVNDEDPPKPVRRAVVTLSGAGLVPDRSAITDDDGRFAISGLPAGRFTLTARRPSFVTSVYGARRPARPGTVIPVGDAQHVENLIVKLWRGATVSGVLRDERGDPVTGLEVRALPARPSDSSSMLTMSNNGVRTDDRGEYRIFGLEPGTYVIAAKPTETSGGPLFSPEESEVDRTIEVLRQRSAGAPGASRAAAPLSAPGKPTDFAPIFFPGVSSAASASPVVLAAGQEMTGLDFAIARVPTVVVEGTVIRPDGSRASGAAVQMGSAPRDSSFPIDPVSFSTTAASDGTFRIPQVPPGNFRLVARAPADANRGAADGNARGGVTEASTWATADVVVSGAELNPLSLQLAPGVTVSGRVTFTGTSKPPADLTRIRVWLRMQSELAPSGAAINGMAWIAPSAVHADGTFAIDNVLPGPCYMTISLAPADSAVWSARSAVVAGRDMLDTPLEITRESAAPGVTITFSDTRTELSGTLQTQSGSPASDVFVIAFSADRQLWGRVSRRIRAVRPGIDGQYSIKDLPPGDYLIGAVSDIDQDEWLDPAVLDRIAAAAVRISLGEGEKKTQDLQIGSR